MEYSKSKLRISAGHGISKLGKISKYSNCRVRTVRYILILILILMLYTVTRTVDRELLWKIMSRYGCPEELIFVLRKLFACPQTAQEEHRYSPCLVLLFVVLRAAERREQSINS